MRTIRGPVWSWRRRLRSAFWSRRGRFRSPWTWPRWPGLQSAAQVGEHRRRSEGQLGHHQAPPEKIAAAKKIIEEFDKGTTIFKPEDPELKKYAVPAGTADAIAKTLMADNPALRVIAVPAANELWVMATPTEHFDLMKKIRESIQPGDTQQTTKSIQLAFSDPADMVAKLTKLYSSSNGGPIIETGAAGTLSIVVKGTSEQIKQIEATVHAYEGTTADGGVKSSSPFQRRLILPDGSASVLAEKLATRSTRCAAIRSLSTTRTIPSAFPRRSHSRRASRCRPRRRPPN